MAEPSSDSARRSPTDSRARTRVYRAGVLEKENFPIAEVSDYLHQADAVVWVDLGAPAPDDLAVVADELGLHQLAVDDAMDTRERPKLDRYRTHDFVNMYAVDLDHDTGAMRLSELSAFITRTRPGHRPQGRRVRHRRRSSPAGTTSSDLAEHGVGFLLYGLIDYVVDSHFEAVQDLDDGDREARGPALRRTCTHDQEVQRRSFALRKSLVLLRRVVLPMREVVNTLHAPRPARRHGGDDALLPGRLRPRPARHRVDRVAARPRRRPSSRPNLTLQGNRLNVITKKVTSWAAIIAVPTAITGWYGQNLPYPGFASTSGLVTSATLIVVISGGLYLLFKRKDWL